MKNDDVSNIEVRNLLQLQVMTRKRYRWDFECEKNPVTSSKSFWNALHSIRVYFYGKEYLSRFAEI